MKRRFNNNDVAVLCNLFHYLNIIIIQLIVVVYFVKISHHHNIDYQIGISENQCPKNILVQGFEFWVINYMCHRPILT